MLLCAILPCATTTLNSFPVLLFSVKVTPTLDSPQAERLHTSWLTKAALPERSRMKSSNDSGILLAAVGVVVGNNSPGVNTLN